MQVPALPGLSLYLPGVVVTSQHECCHCLCSAPPMAQHGSGQQWDRMGTLWGCSGFGASGQFWPHSAGFPTALMGCRLSLRPRSSLQKRQSTGSPAGRHGTAERGCRS